MKTLAVGGVFQHRSVRCSDFCARQRFIDLNLSAIKAAGQKLTARGVSRGSNHKMFHFLPLWRHIDASFKHTYTGREALP